MHVYGQQVLSETIFSNAFFSFAFYSCALISEKGKNILHVQHLDSKNTAILGILKY